MSIFSSWQAGRRRVPQYKRNAVSVVYFTNYVNNQSLKYWNDVALNNHIEIDLGKPFPANNHSLNYPVTGNNLDKYKNQFHLRFI